MNDEKQAIEPSEEEILKSVEDNDIAADEELPAESAKVEDTSADDSEEQLQKQLKDSRQEAQDNWDKLLRVQAEMDNLRRRSEKELQNAHKFALDKFSKELLPVIDSLELGVQAADAEGIEIGKLKEGSELTLRLLASAFEKFMIVAVDPVGEVFNAEYHQAMAMQPTNDHEANTVIKVVQKGYLLNERLIRPAMVVVAQPAEPVKIDEQA